MTRERRRRVAMRYVALSNDHLELYFMPSLPILSYRSPPAPACHVPGDAGIAAHGILRVARRDRHVLHQHMRCQAAGEQGCPRRATDAVGIVAVQVDTVLDQSVDGRSLDLPPNGNIEDAPPPIGLASRPRFLRSACGSRCWPSPGHPPRGTGCGVSSCPMLQSRTAPRASGFSRIPGSVLVYIRSCACR